MLCESSVLEMSGGRANKMMSAPWTWSRGLTFLSSVPNLPRVLFILMPNLPWKLKRTALTHHLGRPAQVAVKAVRMSSAEILFRLTTSLTDAPCEVVAAHQCVLSEVAAARQCLLRAIAFGDTFVGRKISVVDNEQ